MKILRTLPFVVTAILVIWGSAVGIDPSVMWALGILCTIVAGALSIFGYTNMPAPLGIPEGIEKPQSQRRRQQVVSLSLALIFSSLALHWPLRACFYLSRPALERVARQAQRVSAESPQSAGLFTIREAYTHKGEVVLWLDGDGGEPTILVRKLPGHKISRYSGSTVELDDNWYFYSEM